MYIIRIVLVMLSANRRLECSTMSYSGHTHTQSYYAHYLHKLMPVLYWFAWIGQHGRPVLPPWTFSIAAHTTHPYNLVMTNADMQQGTEGCKDEKAEQTVREGMGWREGCKKAETERETVRNKQRDSFINRERWEKSTAVEEGY